MSHKNSLIYNMLFFRGYAYGNYTPVKRKFFCNFLFFIVFNKKDRKEIEKKAEECFYQSITLAQKQRAKSFELRSTTSLCRQNLIEDLK